MVVQLNVLRVLVLFYVLDVKLYTFWMAIPVLKIVLLDFMEKLQNKYAILALERVQLALANYKHNVTLVKVLIIIFTPQVIHVKLLVQ